MTCARCGGPALRLTVAQTRCGPCDREVAAIVARDEQRRRPRFTAKDLTEATR